jgi:hypothetical protein
MPINFPPSPVLYETHTEAGKTWKYVGSEMWNLETSSLLVTASYAITASYALNVQSHPVFPYTGSAIISGSLIVTGSVNAISFTGSLLGTSSISISSSYSDTSSYSITAISASNAVTASYVLSSSYAVTASHALNAISGFPYTGSAIISGSLIVTGSVKISNDITASSMLISGSGVNRLTVVGSGSSSPIFSVVGSQGELFTINDSLSGSLFSVNDISGLPVLEVFSDNRLILGSYQAPSLYTSTRLTSVAGNNIIYANIQTASFDGAFFEYTIRSGSNARAGQIMSILSGSAVNYTEVVTNQFGDTSGVNFAVIIIGSAIALTGSCSTDGWVIKTIIRAI